MNLPSSHCGAATREFLHIFFCSQNSSEITKQNFLILFVFIFPWELSDSCIVCMASCIEVVVCVYVLAIVYMKLSRMDKVKMTWHSSGPAARMNNAAAWRVLATCTNRSLSIQRLSEHENIGVRARERNAWLLLMDHGRALVSVRNHLLSWTIDEPEWAVFDNPAKWNCMMSICLTLVCGLVVRKKSSGYCHQW